MIFAINNIPASMTSLVDSDAGNSRLREVLIVTENLRRNPSWWHGYWLLVATKNR